jgi:predicted nuclease of restriction endonuclease-like (RecB) superfamily
MEQVKIFRSTSEVELEQLINQFLIEMGEDYDVTRIIQSEGASMYITVSIYFEPTLQNLLNN